MLRERHVVAGYGHGMSLICKCDSDSSRDCDCAKLYILKQSCKEDGFRKDRSNLFTHKSPKRA